MLTCTVKNIRYKEYQPHSTMTHPILSIYATIREPPHLDPQPAAYTPNPRNPPTSNQSPSLLRTLCAGWSSSAAFPHGAEARVRLAPSSASRVVGAVAGVMSRVHLSSAEPVLAVLLVDAAPVPCRCLRRLRAVVVELRRWHRRCRCCLLLHHLRRRRRRRLQCAPASPRSIPPRASRALSVHCTAASSLRRGGRFGWSSGRQTVSPCSCSATMLPRLLCMGIRLWD
jgi:hypothetical protein